MHAIDFGREAPLTSVRRSLVVAVVSGLGAVSLLVAGCGGTTTASSSTTISVPSGWTTHTYGKAAIAVPSDWTVVTDYLCYEPKGSGSLFLGPSKRPSVSCLAYDPSVNAVIISPIESGEIARASACEPPIKVNGLVVYVTPCSTSNPAGMTVWTVPALGIRAIASQAGGSWTGSDPSTPVGRVLHTIHRA